MTDIVNESEQGGMDRRSLLKKAAVGGAVAFAAPAVLSKPAWGAVGASDCTPIVTVRALGLIVTGLADPGNSYDHVRVNVVGDAFCSPSDECEDDPNKPNDGLGPAVLVSSQWVLDSAVSTTPAVNGVSNFILVDGVQFNTGNYTTRTDTTWGLPSTQTLTKWVAPGPGVKEIAIIRNGGNTKENLTSGNPASGLIGNVGNWVIDFQVSVKLTYGCQTTAGITQLTCKKFTVAFTYDDEAGLIGSLSGTTTTETSC